MLTTPKEQISYSENNSPSYNDKIPAFYEIWIFTMWLRDGSLAWRIRDMTSHKCSWENLMLYSLRCVEASIFRAFKEFPVLNYLDDGCRKYLRNVGHYINISSQGATFYRIWIILNISLRTSGNSHENLWPVVLTSRPLWDGYKT